MAELQPRAPLLAGISPKPSHSAGPGIQRRTVLSRNKGRILGQGMLQGPQLTLARTVPGVAMRAGVLGFFECPWPGRSPDGATKPPGHGGPACACTCCGQHSGGPPAGIRTLELSAIAHYACFVHGPSCGAAKAGVVANGRNTVIIGLGKQHFSLAPELPNSM